MQNNGPGSEPTLPSDGLLLLFHISAFLINAIGYLARSDGAALSPSFNLIPVFACSTFLMPSRSRLIRETDSQLSPVYERKVYDLRERAHEIRFTHANMDLINSKLQYFLKYSAMSVHILIFPVQRK